MILETSVMTTLMFNKLIKMKQRRVYLPLARARRKITAGSWCCTWCTKNKTMSQNSSKQC